MLQVVIEDRTGRPAAVMRGQGFSFPLLRNPGAARTPLRLQSHAIEMPGSVDHCMTDRRLGKVIFRGIVMVYTKLHSSILTSTVWLEPHATRIVWITLLALANKHGEVSGTVPGIAHQARVTLGECRDAITTFLSPDPDSRTPDVAGRRLEAIPGGWQILNYEKYRLEASKDDQREKTKARTRRWRERQANGSVTQKASHLNGCDGAVTHDRDIAEADTDSESDYESRTGINTESLSEKESLTSTGVRRRKSKTGRPPQVSHGDFRPPPGRVNGVEPEAPIPGDWKPTTAAQEKIAKALTWITPAVAQLRMVEFQAWAEGKVFPPRDRDRIWIRFMLRTRPGEYADSSPKGFNG